MAVLHGEKIRSKLLTGVNRLADAVVVTLGPRGRNVCIEKSFGAPLITKDGVSVAKEVELHDPWENMGARLIREASSKTSDDAGDGTTTATVLARAMIVEGLKLVVSGFAPIDIKRGMDRALVYIDAVIDELSTPLQSQIDIESIATLSANGDAEVGRIVAEAVMKVGKDGVVNIEEGRSTSIVIEATDGMRIDRGWLNQTFIMDEEKRTSVLENAHVFISDMPLSSLRHMVGVLDQIIDTGRPVLWVAPDFETDAVATLYPNLQRKVLISQPMKAPGFGFQQQEILKDLAVLTGATLVTKELGMTFRDVTLDMFGTARLVTLTEKHTTIVDGVGTPEALDERISSLRAQLTASGSEFDKEKIQERIGKLLGGICSIKVGASSELALRELKGRLEDALHATRAAIDEGLVPGGGVCLARACKTALASIDEDVPVEELPGFRVACNACLEPFYAILRNAGVKSPGKYLDQILESNDIFLGVDARTLELVNLRDKGVLDPTKVVRATITNAISVAGILITTEAGIRKT